MQVRAFNALVRLYPQNLRSCGSSPANCSLYAGLWATHPESTVVESCIDVLAYPAYQEKFTAVTDADILPAIVTLWVSVNIAFAMEADVPIRTRLRLSNA
jgi:hypothetical protein